MKNIEQDRSNILNDYVEKTIVIQDHYDKVVFILSGSGKSETREIKIEMDKGCENLYIHSEKPMKITKIGNQYADLELVD